MSIPAGAGSLIGKRLGKHEILALLALGGTAEIYLARVGGAGGFEKYVVIKCLHDHLADDQDFVKMFLDEARLAALLDHSNIVQTFELGEYENRYYMVMEFLAGLSLAMVVRRATERFPNGMLPVPLIFNIAAQAAAGLHYAHERTANGKPLNMVHRDISPQNLVVSFEGVVKVVDFGIARAELRETKTKAGTIKGKFAYMSPEQCVAANVDRRTDVFALGVIVHELLTGRRLFKRNSPYETYQAVIECAVDPPSRVNDDVDPTIDEIVMKAVAKDKEKRYATAEAFGDALLGFLHHRGKGSGGNEIQRFFEQYFQDEIQEHGERMRELISGRDFSVDTNLKWGDEDEKRMQTVDLGAKLEDSAISLVTGEIEELRTGDTASLDVENDEDEIPAERTRIELNPLQKVEELNQQVARNSASQIPAFGAAVSSGKALPRTPVPLGSVTSGPEPLPAPPTVPRAIVPTKDSGKFPNLPHMPTAIADDPSSPELAPTALGKMVVDQSQLMVPSVGPASATQYSVRASEMQGAQNGQPPAPQQMPGYPQPQSGPYAQPQHGPYAPQQSGPYAPQQSGPYAQPQSGPYAQPQSEPYPQPQNGPYAQPQSGPHAQPQSGPHAPQNGPHPQQNGPYPQQGGPYPQQGGPYPQQGGPYPQQGGPYPQQGGPYPQQGGPYPQQSGPYPQQSGPYPQQSGYPQQPMMSYPVLPGGQRPFSSDLAPSNMSAPRSSYPSMPLDPGSAASLMSPVGEHYPQTDWQRAAAAPAKALPTWLLIALFAAALGGALLLTLVIAKIAS